MKFILNYFSSVKLAITLLIIITLASILGTLIPQGRAEAEYAARYGQLAPLLIRLEVTDLYHSLLYRGLLYLFALNTAVCTLTRFGAKFRKAFRPRVEGEASKIRTLKSSGAFKLKGSLEQAAQKVESALKSRHFRTRQTVHEGRVSILAQKRIAGLFGSDIVHVGLLIILAGGIISGGDAGMRRMLTIHEGRTLEVPEAGISLRLDKFQTDYYPSGAVKDWKSTLTVIEDGQEIRTQTIEVNHPLSFRGFMFYQSSYGYDWENPRFEILAQKKDDPDFGDQLNLGLGEKTLLSDGQTEVEVIDFVPDFIIGEDGRVASRSNQPNNPAVLIEGPPGCSPSSRTSARCIPKRNTNSPSSSRTSNPPNTRASRWRRIRESTSYGRAASCSRWACSWPFSGPRPRSGRSWRGRRTGSRPRPAALPPRTKMHSRRNSTQSWKI
jgi:cytochrome c biogenesis protein